MKIDLLFEGDHVAQAETQEEMFALNGQHADRIVCACSAFFALFWVVVELLDLAGLLNVSEAIGFHLSIFSASSFLVPVIVYFLVKGNWSKYRYFSLLFLAVMFAAVHVTSQGYLIVNFCFPVLLSALYFSERFSFIIGCTTIGMAMASYGAVWLLQQSPEFLSYQYDYLGYLPYHTLTDMVIGACVPVIMVLGLFTYLSCIIATHGKSMVQRQAEVSARAAKSASELKTAASLQRDIMPNDFDVRIGDGIDLYASVQPAKETAGDFYDFFEADEHMLHVVVADVSDKGLRSAMFMMLVRNTLRSLLVPSVPLEKVVGRANKVLASDSNEGMFVTALVMRIDTLTGHVEYVNAGHLPPLVRDVSGMVRCVDDRLIPPDVIMGMYDDAVFSVRTFDLRPGDMLVGFTDGATDAENEQGEFFGQQRLINAVVDASVQNGSEEFCAFVLSRIDEFAKSESRFDDVTLLALRFNPDEALWLPARQDTVDHVVEWVNDSLAKTDCPEDTRRLIDVVIDDAVVNIVNYAYAGDSGKAHTEKTDDTDQGVLMRCHAENGKILLTFSDAGVEFDPTTAEVPQREFGGLGIQFIMSIMDDVRYCRRGQFNVLQMEKRW